VAEQKRAERRNSISSLVSRILERVPDEDRASMTVDSWWKTTEAESGRPRDETFETAASIDDDLERLLDVLDLRSSTPPRNLYGLPAAGAINDAISPESCKRGEGRG
jgi:hypothetical protein